MVLTAIFLFVHVYTYQLFSFMFHMYHLHPVTDNAIFSKCCKYNKPYVMVITILFSNKNSLLYEWAHVQVNTTSIMLVHVNIYIIFI